MEYSEFRDIVWDHYAHNARQMPWRDQHDLYSVLVSELMLQQTQVERVRTKFAEFMYAFPTVQDLADAPLASVLEHWQGLGYNRRAKFLHESAKMLATLDTPPQTVMELQRLPGVGKNTAGAIMAYVYNQPVVFIETNIRTVYFHHFFPGRDDVSDRELERVVQDTVDHEHPREWYWALMDYGSFLKSSGVKNISASKHYKKQSALEGSVRQVRGQIIRELTLGSPRTEDELKQTLDADERWSQAMAGLERDGLVIIDGKTVSLKR